MKYYDKDKLDNIMSQENFDVYGTCNELERYCSRYPKDRMASQYYARILIKVGRLDDAETELNRLKSLIEEARKEGKNNPINIDKDENCLRGITLKLLAYQRKYEVALAYFKRYEESINQCNEMTSLIILYCNHQLGRLPKNYIRTDYHYQTRQIIDYQESDCLYHIKMKHISQNGGTQQSQEETSFFANDFPLDIIYQEVKRIIAEFRSVSNQEARRINCNFPMNKYTFKYPNCGRSKGQLVDYFTVVVLFDTNNIITMYPSPDCENLPHFDLTHMLQPSNKQKQHTRSRIARFNERYGQPKK